MAAGVSARLTPAEGRKFGFLVGGAFLVLGLLMWHRGRLVPAYVVLGVAALLILGGLIAPGSLAPIYHGWMAVGKAISKVTTPIIMGALFFLVLTPAGFLARMLGHRPLARPGGTTYWHSRPAGSGRGDLDHQY